MESRKMVLLNLFAGQQWRHKYREQTYGYGGEWEEGESGSYDEIKMETYILPYVK